MKSTMTSLTLIAILVPTLASAGQIYGTIVLDGKGVRELAIDVTCGSSDPISARTAADGGYRLNVPQQGQCTLTLPSYAGKPSATVFSTSNPSVYNFELVKNADGTFALKRRS